MVKITELFDAETITGEEKIPIVQDGVMRKASVLDFVSAWKTDDIFIAGSSGLSVASAALFMDGRLERFSTTDGRVWTFSGPRLSSLRTDNAANDRVVFVPGFTGDVVSLVLSLDDRVASFDDGLGRRWHYDAGWSLGGSLDAIRTVIDDVFVPGFTVAVGEISISSDGRASSVIDTAGKRWFYDTGWSLGRFIDTSRSVTDDIFVPGFADAISEISISADGRASSIIDTAGKRWFYAERWTYGAAQVSGDADVDVLIYGSSVGGLTAAIRAKQRGMKVAIIEPYPAYGGMHAHGLCWVDLPILASVGGSWENTIGGVTRSVYFDRVAALEGAGFNGRWKASANSYEQAAKSIIDQYTDMAFLDVQIDGARQVFVETDAVSGARDIRGVMTPQGMIRCKTAIDASYEFDLGAAALGRNGYIMGRESQAAYDEPLAGVTAPQVFANDGKAYPWRDWSGLGSPLAISDLPTDLPLILPEQGVPLGGADGAVQAYNFRLNHTRDPAKYVPFEKPAGYDYRHCLLMAESNIVRRNLTRFLRGPGSFGWMGALSDPTRFQFNQLDCANLQQDYATASWRRRREIMDQHVYMTKALMWFLAHDPKAREYGMAALQDDINDVTRPAGVAPSGPAGLCGDEFVGSPYGDGWPYWMYVRETRRLRARRIMTQRDQMEVANGGTPTKADSVGKWSYGWDIHNSYLRQVNDSFGAPRVDRFENDGGVAYTGHSSSAWYQMSAAMIWPAADMKMRNLIVPVASGNTRIAFGPQRLEAAFGILGEAAGENAAWLVDNPGMSADQHPYSDLRSRLLERGALL